MRQVAFLNSRRESRHGLETLAILFALPYALLMWAYVLFASFIMNASINVRLSSRMVAFLISFSFWTFENADLLVYLLIGLVYLGVTLMVLWCVSTSWEDGRDFFDRIVMIVRSAFRKMIFKGDDAPSEEASVAKEKTKQLGWSWQSLWIWKRRTSMSSSVTAV
jgi:hypothetical protein